MPELGRAVADRWPEAGYRALGELLVAVLPLIQVPPRGLWRTSAGVRRSLVCDWLGREVDPLPPEAADPVGQVLVRAYWPPTDRPLPPICGPGVASPACRTRPGRTRHPGAGAIPIGVRQCAARYDDRRRIVADAHRGLSVNGVRVVLLDGQVAASWTVEGDMTDDVRWWCTT